MSEKFRKLARIWAKDVVHDGLHEDRLAVVFTEIAAKARLEEAQIWRPIGCVRAEHKPLRSPLCDVCQQMARWEERIAELKKEVEHVGLAITGS